MGISYHFVLLYYHPKPFIIRNKYANIPANPVFDLIFLVRNQIDLTVPFRAHEYENSLKSRVFQNHITIKHFYTLSLRMWTSKIPRLLFSVSPTTVPNLYTVTLLLHLTQWTFSLCPTLGIFLFFLSNWKFVFFPTSVFFLSPILENTPKLFHSNPRV